MNQNILEIHHLSKDYGTFRLEDVSFSLPRGVIMGLIGENGAGKSTTINCILGEVQKSGGEITLFGQAQAASEKENKDRIGVVFDENHFPDLFTPKELGQVMAGVYSHWDWAAYHAFLSRFSLREDQKIKDFSKGMKVKLAFAVALSHGAELLILDEATSGLDPIVRDEVLDLLLDFVQDERHGVLVSSHITSDLERIADYITFIHQGKVLLSENKDEILYGYGIAKAGREQLHRVDRTLVAAIQDTPYGSEALITDRERFEREYPDIVLDPVDFDEMMVLLCRGQKL